MWEGIMRKLLASAVLAVSLAVVPGHADPGNGCIVETTGGAQDTYVTCTYDATGPGRYVLATPNDWSITARRGSRTFVLAAGGALSTPGAGDIASQAGDVVTVRVGSVPGGDCASEGVCGWIGSVMAFETE
jgi:large exoprotein involved in heme utilization and adhesion